jgi:hypothetical protein
MKEIIRIAMCVLLLGFGVERAADSKRLFAADSKSESPAKPEDSDKQADIKKLNEKKIDAKGALAGARKALAVMIKEARADKGLDPKTPKNKPFWNAIQKISKQLARAEKGLKDKNDDFFKAISDARSAEEQMKVDWQLTDSQNQKVVDAGKKLGYALAVLRTDYSKEVARKKKGGPLTAKEKEQFAKIKQQQTALLTKINVLETKADKDKGLEHGLKQIAARANRVVKAPETLDAFLATLYVLDEIEGLLYAYDYYVDKAWRTYWVDVPALTNSWEGIYSDILTSEAYNWADVSVATDLDPLEDFTVTEDITEDEITSQEKFAENESFAMTDAEASGVAEAENTDAEVESDDIADDDSMEDDSDDQGEDFDGDGSDNGGNDEDHDGEDEDNGDDDGGDDVD